MESTLKYLALSEKCYRETLPEHSIVTEKEYNEYKILDDFKPDSINQLVAIAKYQVIIKSAMNMNQSVMKYGVSYSHYIKHPEVLTNDLGIQLTPEGLIPNSDSKLTSLDLRVLKSTIALEYRLDTQLIRMILELKRCFEGSSDIKSSIESVLGVELPADFIKGETDEIQWNLLFSPVLESLKINGFLTTKEEEEGHEESKEEERLEETYNLTAEEKASTLNVLYLTDRIAFEAQINDADAFTRFVMSQRNRFIPDLTKPLNLLLPSPRTDDLIDTIRAADNQSVSAFLCENEARYPNQLYLRVSMLSYIEYYFKDVFKELCKKLLQWKPDLLEPVIKSYVDSDFIFSEPSTEILTMARIVAQNSTNRALLLKIRANKLLNGKDSVAILENQSIFELLELASLASSFEYKDTDLHETNRENYTLVKVMNILPNTPKPDQFKALIRYMSSLTPTQFFSNKLVSKYYEPIVPFCLCHIPTFDNLIIEQFEKLAQEQKQEVLLSSFIKPNGFVSIIETPFWFLLVDNAKLRDYFISHLETLCPKDQKALLLCKNNSTRFIRLENISKFPEEIFHKLCAIVEKLDDPEVYSALGWLYTNESILERHPNIISNHPKILEAASDTLKKESQPHAVHLIYRLEKLPETQNYLIETYEGELKPFLMTYFLNDEASITQAETFVKSLNGKDKARFIEFLLRAGDTREVSEHAQILLIKLFSPITFLREHEIEYVTQEKSFKMWDEPAAKWLAEHAPKKINSYLIEQTQSGHKEDTFKAARLILNSNKFHLLNEEFLGIYFDYVTKAETLMDLLHRLSLPNLEKIIKENSPSLKTLKEPMQNIAYLAIKLLKQNKVEALTPATQKLASDLLKHLFWHGLSKEALTILKRLSRNPENQNLFSPAKVSYYIYLTPDRTARCRILWHATAACKDKLSRLHMLSFLSYRLPEDILSNNSLKDAFLDISTEDLIKYMTSHTCNLFGLQPPLHANHHDILPSIFYNDDSRLLKCVMIRLQTFSTENLKQIFACKRHLSSIFVRPIRETNKPTHPLLELLEEKFTPMELFQLLKEQHIEQHYTDSSLQYGHWFAKTWLKTAPQSELLSYPHLVSEQFKAEINPEGYQELAELLKKRKAESAASVSMSTTPITQASLSPEGHAETKALEGPEI